MNGTIYEDNCMCICPPGFMGPTCSQAQSCFNVTNGTNVTMCQNGGIANLNSTGNCSCLCMEGFYGTFCEYEMLCNSSGFTNGTDCYNGGTLNGNCTCNCADYFYGP